MKNFSLTLAALAIVALVFPVCAHADMPVFSKPQFTTTIKCDKQVSVDKDTDLAKIECNQQDLKTYPFLADLTKDPTVKDSTYQFDIARVDDKVSGKPLLLVNMHNEMIYTIWGSAGAFAINANGSYNAQWSITGGTIAYTSSCPKKFAFIIHGNERNTFAEWDYDGKSITRIAGYDKLEDFPACN